MDIKQQYETFLRMLLPQEIFEYFDVVKIEDIGNQIHIFVDEKNILPQGLPEEEYQSKGFHTESIIQDFPLREKAVFIHARRRKWQNTKTLSIVSNNFDLTATGTRYSEEFAAFLKEIVGFFPDKQ